MALCICSTASRNIDLGVRTDTTIPSSAIVECSFFQPGYTCTIDYGTDPSYTNLIYRDTSSTQGRIVTIVLSQRLRADTIYYYNVSAENDSQCVRVQGRFWAGGYLSFSVYQLGICLLNVLVNHLSAWSLHQADRWFSCKNLL